MFHHSEHKDELYILVMNSIEESKSIYILLLLILTKYEIIIFAAGPAETKKIKLFFFA